MTDRLNPEALEQQALEAAAKALRDDHANRAEYYVVPEWNDTPYGQKLVFRGKARAAVSAYLAALPAPRTITTVEELEASPAETVIKAADGNVYEQNTLDPRLSVQWVATGSKYPVVPECVELPARVLWVPTEGGGE